MRWYALMAGSLTVLAIALYILSRQEPETGKLRRRVPEAFEKGLKDVVLVP